MYHLRLPFIIVLCMSGSFVQPADILFVNMYNSKSHALSMMPLAKQLAGEGNRVAIFSMMLYAMNDFGGSVENLQALPSHDAFKTLAKHFGLVVWQYDFSPIMMYRAIGIADKFFTQSIGSEALNTTLNTPWDIVIADELFPVAGMAISIYCKKKFGSRTALFSTTDLIGNHGMVRALSRNPVIEPNHYMRFDDLHKDWTRFMSRMSSVKDRIIDLLGTGIMARQVLYTGAQKIGLKIESDDILDTYSLTINDYPSIHRWPAPIASSIVFTTPKCEESQTLSENLEKFVSEPRSWGTIYVAFGSMADWASAPANVITSFVNAFNALSEYRIIWSSRKDRPEGLADHVMMLKWAPQTAILMHNQTKLFFTHAGLKSIREAICAEVPMLAMPFFADQAKNSYLGKADGFARIIHKRDVNADVLLSSIREMLHNSSYKESAHKVHKFWAESVLAPLKQETFWVQRILRARTERITFPIRGARLGWIPFLGIDVIVALLIVVYIVSK